MAGVDVFALHQGFEQSGLEQHAGQHRDDHHHPEQSELGGAQRARQHHHRAQPHALDQAFRHDVVAHTARELAPQGRHAELRRLRGGDRIGFQ